MSAWYKRKWAIALFIIVGLGIIGGYMDASIESQTQQPTQPTETESKIEQQTQVDTSSDKPEAPEIEKSQTSEEKIEPEIKAEPLLITKSTDEMLPTREDIPTEFVMDDIKDVELATSIKGFESGKSLSASKLVGTFAPGLIVVHFKVLKFLSVDDAKEYYGSKVSEIKNDGGYTELNIKTDNSDCFSWKQDYGYDARFVTSICQNNNIFYEVFVSASQTFENPDSYLKSMLPVIDAKIN